VLNHSGGDLGDFNEWSGTFGELGSNIKCIIDGIDGIIEGDGTFVEGLGIKSSDVVNQFQVLSVLDQVIFVSG